MCARARVRACVRACVGTWVRGHEPRCQRGDLSEVDSSLDIVAWCNCCMCNYMGMGVVAWALWFDGFCGGYGGFDTPRDASNCNGFSGGLRYRLAHQ